MNILAKIRGLYASIVIIAVVTLNIFTFLISPKKYYKSIKRFYTRLILKLLGIKVEVEGKIDKEAKMVIINHSSMLDIVLIEAYYPYDLVWIAKKELFDMPFFGLLLKLPQNIRLDRENKKSIVYLFKEAKEKSKYKTIAIFPEGTRARGERLLPFKPGTKIISEKLNLKVQPIVLVCSKERFDSKSLTLNPGIAKIIYLDSFYPNSNEDWLKELRDRMQKILDSEKSKLCAKV